MTASEGPPIGLVLGSALEPERITQAAQLGEQHGFSELWFAEDYFFTGGISGATAALAATQRIPVGLGIVSAMVRHPSVLAMELATMSRMYPGRVMPGIGLGVPYWLGQMGLYPKSQLTAMRECITSVRGLLAGEELTRDGDYFDFDQVKLAHPPSEALPLSMGVIGPKMLELSGEIADGTVVSVLAAPEYVRWTRERIAAGAAQAGRNAAKHRIATFVLYAADTDGKKAKESLRDLTAFYLSAMPKSALTDVYGVAEELATMVSGGQEQVAREMPASWLEDLVVAGTPDECAEKIGRYLDAGSDSVVLFPASAEGIEELVKLAAREVLPRI
jgi:5,10-methylenetetrahydromethanopterin reductase